MKTKYNVLIAKILFKLFSILKFSQKRQVKRNGIYWEVDLSEAIDLSIFLFGKFEYSVIKTANKIIDTETYDGQKIASSRVIGKIKETDIYGTLTGSERYNMRKIDPAEVNKLRRFFSSVRSKNKTISKISYK